MPSLPAGSADRAAGTTTRRESTYWPGRSWASTRTPLPSRCSAGHGEGPRRAAAVTSGRGALTRRPRWWRTRHPRDRRRPRRRRRGRRRRPGCSGRSQRRAASTTCSAVTSRSRSRWVLTTSGSSWSSRWWLIRSARSSWLARAESQDRSDWASEASSSTSVGPCSRKPSSSSTKSASTRARVGAGRDVEHDEAQRGAVDEAPRGGVRPERGLLAAHQPPDQP